MSSSRYIYNLVEEIKNKYNTSDIYDIADAENINIVYTKDLQSALGAYISTFYATVIVVKEGLPKKLAEFVIAHELGHHFLHKGDTYSEIESYLYKPSNKTLKQEHEANVFASHLILSNEAFLNMTQDTEYFCDFPNHIFETKKKEMEKLGTI